MLPNWLTFPKYFWSKHKKQIWVQNECESVKMREFESKKVWEAVDVISKTTSIPKISYSYWTITQRGIKWWVNDCDIVTVLEHQTVIPIECETQIVWMGNVGIEVFFFYTLAFLHTISTLYFHPQSHSTCCKVSKNI